MVDNIFIGLMTGTSADSLDCAAINFLDDEMCILGLKNYDIPNKLKDQIKENTQADELDSIKIKELDVSLGIFFSNSIKDFLKSLSLDNEQITAVGSHGQTIKHEPQSINPFSLQVGDPQIVSNILGIQTIGKFRDDDIASGGQGAPLSPIFHKEVFFNSLEERIIANIGGITNISIISNQELIGFDTGPGNCLLDAWHKENLGGDYDKDGTWAKSGKVNNYLLEVLMNDGYFKSNYPKSTGPDYFNLRWLRRYLEEVNQEITANDVQATLAELTALSLANSLNDIDHKSEYVYFCGGGIHNLDLQERIKKNIEQICVTTSNLGVDPDYLEAICFAWLAKQRIDGIKFNMKEITGSNEEVYLGKVFDPVK